MDLLAGAGGVVVTLLVNLVVVAQYFGRLSERVNGMDSRLERIEKMIDRRWPEM